MKNKFTILASVFAVFVFCTYAVNATFAASTPVATTTSVGFWSLIADAGWMAKFVLLLLFVASLLSWSVIFMKNKILKNAEKESKEFLNLFWYGQDFEEVFMKCEKLSKSPVSNVFKAGFKEMKKISQIDASSTPKNQILTGGLDNIQRSLNRTVSQELQSLEKNVGYLATVGSAAPFVGLFGTVWGIMDSFQNIGATGNANLAVVAPGISEALIATAFGLLAAIPAVIAYNIFVNRIKAITTEMDNFSQDFLNIIQRSLLK